MAVYFIQCGNYIKIGHADDPERRLRELQTGNPNKLELLGYVSGDIVREREIHFTFADFRTDGEWFELTTDILAYLQQNKADSVATRKSKLVPKRVTSKRKGMYRQDSAGWIEYSRQGERYYARERWWEKGEDGKWRKKAKYRKDLPVLSPHEYEAWRATSGK